MKISHLLLAFIISLAPTLAFAQGGSWDKIEYEVTDLGHGIYALHGAGGAIGLSVGEDGAFLIDAQYAPLAPKLKAAIAEPVDRTFGGVDIYCAKTATVEALIRRGIARPYFVYGAPPRGHEFFALVEKLRRDHE